MSDAGFQSSVQASSHKEPARLANCRVVGLLNGNELFGHEKANIEVFKALRRQGAEVHVGINSTDNGGAVGELLRLLGFRTFNVPFGCQWSKTFFKAKPTLILSCIRQVVQSSAVLRREIRDFKPTHIHIGNALVYSYVAPALALTRTRLIFRVGDEPPHDSATNLCIWKACYRRASNVIGNSRFILNSIKQIYVDESRRLDLIYSVAPEMRDGDRLLSSRTGQRILYVGQISALKGVDHLITAAIALADQRSDIVFDIVGGSQYTVSFEEALKRRISDAGLHQRIIFHGQVSDPGPFYLGARLLVVPTVCAEAAANVVLEAKRFGLPSVVYPSGGLPELVRHEVDGFVCAEKSVAALMDGINWFLDDPNRCQAAGEAAGRS